MTSDAARTRADPDLLATWVTGWALARQTSPPAPHADGHRVEVGWPEQARRYVFPHLSGEIERLGAACRDPWVYLKACVPPGALRAVLPPPWTVAPPSYLMTVDRLDHPVPTPVGGYAVVLADAPAGAAVRIVAAGALAASGGVVVVGETAIFDRIVTDPAHQRRGLGTRVMAALGQAARDRGARRAVLVATGDGRGLYAALGWTVHTPYASAVIPGPTG